MFLIIEHSGTQDQMKIAEDIYELLKKHQASDREVDISEKKQEITNIINIKIDNPKKTQKENCQRWMYSKFLGLTLINAIKNRPDKDEIVKDIYLYASSQHSLSGVYYKLT